MTREEQEWKRNHETSRKLEIAEKLPPRDYIECTLSAKNPNILQVEARRGNSVHLIRLPIAWLPPFLGNGRTLNKPWVDPELGKLQSRIEKDGGSSVDRELLNDIYRQASGGSQKGLLVFSLEQNVAADVMGMKAAVVIEGSETHSRTGFMDVDLGEIPELASLRDQLPSTRIQLPVTHAKVFGWYDNEYGSYTNLLGDLTVHVHRSCS